MPGVAIIQPSYIPWKGFFHIIARVDVFIHLDEVQYSVRSWRNRNQIKLPAGGKCWLSVPVLGGTKQQRICDVRIDDGQPWRRKHLTALRHSYGKEPYFREYFPAIEAIYDEGHDSIADLDIELTEHIARLLGLATRFLRSSSLGVEGQKTERLVQLVERVGGTRYLSGPSAAAYIEPELFAARGIELQYQSYDNYPEYTQVGGTFDHHVTVLDLLFAVGPAAPRYVWGES
jgi:hypothetical protein